MATKIYALMDGITCLYVGKTKHWKHRERSHKNKYGNCSSKYIPKDIQWTMELIEECEDNIAKEKERLYIELFNPLYNYQLPGQTNYEAKKKWCIKNRDRINECQQARRKAKKA